MAHTAQDVAEWMLAQFERRGQLYQSDAVDGIVREFGDDFVYTNATGGRSINRKVLDAFRKLTEETAVYNRAWRGWSKRTAHDNPDGRRGQW